MREWSEQDARRARAALPAHVRGERVEVTGHACPDCPLGAPQPFCETCLGAGVVSTDRLDRWQARHPG